MATKRTTRARRTAGEGEIYEAVLAALLDGRLPAGTPLREQHLAAMFGATRGRARKVLIRLGHEGRLELIPNRGAFVPTPSLADARRVFAARRVLEAGIVATLAQGLAKRDLEKLRRHLETERRAAAAGRRHDSVKLSAAFHTLLAQMSATRRPPSRSTACSSRRSSSSRSTIRRRSRTARRPSKSRSSRRSPPATSSGRSRS
jgi:DNA-binding GntR family transcriptional regulator